MNATAQLDFGFPHPPQAEALATVGEEKPHLLPRRRYHGSSLAAREWEGLPPPRFLSWQGERAWEVGIPQFGPI